MSQLTLLDDLKDRLKLEFSSSEVLFHARIPVIKHVTKKNNRPFFKNRSSGQFFLGKSKDLRDAETSLVMHLKSRKNELSLQTINEPIWCIFLFYYPYEEFFTKKGSPNKKRGDLSNLYQLPEDCLQEAGIIENDDLICAHDLSRRLLGEKKELEIFILKHTLDVGEL
jgi:Holliday junction resolvase RusA-like endonuclease